MTPATVRVEPMDEARAVATRAALASLPESFAVVTAGGADAAVVAVSGEEDWPDRVDAAIAGGAQGVFVVEPVPDARADRLERAGSPVPVVLCEAWASGEVVALLADRWADAVGGCGLIELSAVEPRAGRPLREVTHRQQRVLRALGVELAALAVASENSDATVAVGRASSGARIVLSAYRSEVGDGALEVNVVGREVVIAATVPPAHTARPGTATRTTADGSVQLPLAWQSTMRRSWLLMREMLRERAAPEELTMTRVS